MVSSWRGSCRTVFVLVRVRVCVSRAVLLYSPVCGVCIVSYCCPVRGVPKRPLQVTFATSNLFGPAE